MSIWSNLLKPAHRMLSSLGYALVTKITAQTLGRKPSRTCQIPGLYEIVAERIEPSHRGFFVEVGAYDGERFSNTSWLADNGWRGVYVEPSPLFSRLCKLRHCLNNTTVMNVAAGESDSEGTLMQVGALSTMSTNTFEEYDRIPWARKQVKKHFQQQTTHIRTLDSILEEANCPVGFELLVVDVEGYEENVFRGFDLPRWQPQLVIVELCDIHPDFSGNAALTLSARRVRDSIQAAGYQEVYRDTINTIFQRQSVSSNIKIDSKKSVA